MNRLFYLLITVCLLCACGGVTDRAKDAIKEGGEIVGETVGEFGKGVAGGLEEVFQLEIALSDSLRDKGIKLGKISLEGAEGGTDNVLVVYMIFARDFNETIRAWTYDPNDLEMGRTETKVEANSGDATYFEFRFNKRTNIDRDSKIIMKL